jgi:diguanylate cyclase (GGDEF)-like protein/PAS domain S-box-containing protein
MRSPDRKLVVFVTWLAGISALLVALVVPLGFFSLSYGSLSSSTQTTAAIKGEMAEQIISSTPDIWQYQTLRLEAAIGQHSHYAGKEDVVIQDRSGNVVAQHGHGIIPLPLLSRSVELFDSGKAVGRLVVNRSLRGLLYGTAAAALVGLLLGAFIFQSLRTLPLRALKRTFDALSLEKERAEVTLHSIGDAVITTDARECVVYLNPVAEQLTGWRTAAASKQALSAVFQVLDEQTGESEDNPLKQAIAEKRIVSISNHRLLVRNDGSRIAIEDNAAPIMLPDGDVIGGVLVFRDVTMARRLTQQLHWQANHDALTGLANRNEFERRLDEALDNVRGTGGQHVVCYLDLDQFKIINDTCGHAAGDELLRQLAMTLQQHLRQSDLLARLGGDEFGVLLLGCLLEKAQDIAENLRAAVEAFRFNWDNNVFSVGVSIGIVELSADSISKEDVLSAADSACYAAKEGGRNRVVTYRPENRLALDSLSKTDWASRLTRALSEGRLMLYFQECLPLGTPVGTSRHIELQLRLLDELGNVIAPGAFLSAAERNDLIPRIDRWVIETAFAKMDGLTAAFGDDLVCSFNLSGASFVDEQLPDFIRDQAALRHIRADTICFQFPEVAVINQLRVASRWLQDLKADGYRFALGAFGAGMSSFTYLRSLAIDYIKIDGSLVNNATTDPLSKAIVGSINDICHTVGLRTVAEQVASEAALEQVRTIGVDFAQGRAISEPAKLPFDATTGNLPADG